MWSLQSQHLGYLTHSPPLACWVASGLRSPGTASWLGLKIPLLDHPSARKNRANNPQWPSECRASHHCYPKRHPASSWPQSPAQGGVRMWSTWRKFMSCGQFPTSQRVELTNKLANHMLWKGEEATSKLGKHRQNTLPREGSIWAECKWEH